MSADDKKKLNNLDTYNTATSQSCNKASAFNTTATSWSGNTPYVIRRGNIVYLFMDFQNSTVEASSDTQITTLPNTAYYPKKRTSLTITPNRMNAASTVTSYAFPYVAIETDGKVYVGGYYGSEHKGLRVIMSYPIEET